MYERLLDQQQEPNLPQIKAYLGESGYGRLCMLEERLTAQYRLQRELRFPFGSKYGWGFKYSHNASHLCYAFFERDAFTVMVQVGDKQVPALEACLDGMSENARTLWEQRYPCGDRGGWVHIRVLEDTDLEDTLCFIHAKKQPPRQKK